MPYIRPQEQKRLLAAIDKVLIGHKGELTFLINALQMKYCEQHLKDPAPLGSGQQRVDYQLLSDAAASLCDAEFEWRTRVMIPYEQHKMRENGDIFRDFIRKANI
jgi:hypothetical protein